MKHKKIPEGYKDSSLGIIPKEWEVKKLGEISEISSGGTPLREKAEYWNGDIPWITTSLINQSIINKADEFITELGLYNSAAKIIKKGALLMAMYGQGMTRGKVSKLNISATTNQACAAIQIKENHTDYIFYTLDHLYYDIRSLSNDGGQKNLSLELIKNIKISIPSITEQKKIAEILNTWDEAIDKQTKLIDTLIRRKRALMQQLLTGKKRVPGFKSKWQYIELGELLEYEQPTKYLVKEVEYCRNYKTPVLTAGKTFILGYTNEEFGIYDNLPVILFDDFTTTSKYIDFKFKVKSSATKLLHPKNGDDINFIYNAMQQIKYVIGGHERHWISKYSYIPIPIPSLKEQQAIAKVLSTANCEIKLVQKYLNIFQTQKRGLMQQLLTGKKRIKT